MHWLALGLFAALPLQWFSVGATPFGSGRLHLLAIFAFAAVVFSRYRLRAHVPALRVSAEFVLLNLCLLAAWALMDLYNSIPPRGPLEQLLYLASFVACATYFHRVAGGREPGAVAALRWAAPVTCAAVLLGFTLAMSVNGVNAPAVFGQAVAAADPEVLQKQVFEPAFAGFGLDEEAVQGNLRHEIFGSVLLALLVSTWAMRYGPATTRTERTVYAVSLATGILLLAVSLSRSILVAAAVWPLVVLYRAVTSGALSSRQLATVAFGLVGLAVLVVSGFGRVLWVRFTAETTGYDARAGNYSDAFGTFSDHWLTGGFDTSAGGVSSHNFVLDSWLRGGVLTAVPAILLSLLLVAVWVRLVVTLRRRPDWVVPLAAALALPLVRMGTSGGGLIPPVEWVALAFVFGTLAAGAGESGARARQSVQPVSASTRAAR